MLFVCTFDAIFELAPIVRELFGHFVDPAWHIATDRGPDDHALTDVEFMRGRRVQVNAAPSRLSCRKPRKTRVFTAVRESSRESRFNLRAIAANISELLRSLDKPLLAELPFFVGC
jgi:hypothetical protein